MKKINQILLITFLSHILFSCEDVIYVDVQDTPTRLVIEASLDWEKGTSGNEQSIFIRTSTPFFNTDSNTAITGASVVVTNNSNNSEYVFEDLGTGEYSTADFEPKIGASYTLEVINEGEIYEATETLYPVTDLTVLGQSREDGFSEEDLEVNLTLVDPEEEGNNYFFKFQKRGELLPIFEEFDDEFINGNEVDWYLEIGEDDETEKKEAFQPGDTVDIEFYAISPAYKEYFQILVNQIGGVGLFESIPVAVKGNCVNLTNSENYAHGYFRVTEVVKISYTFE
ncbi:uncharacterized protein DUF4249 [Flavobacteriaceae bacterium MAR_2009_75]|nr:uncharacterized protein DUF4249 [Flavobacteriaceae bacterium MAR_2009_75]